MILLYASLIAGMAPMTADASVDSDVATCIVDNDSRDVKTLLRTLPGSAEERAVGRKIMVFYGGCADNRVATGEIGWRERAEIAHAALLGLLDTPRFDDARFVTAAPPRADWALAVTGSRGGYNQRLVSIRQFGDCVAGLAPGNALRLVRSEAGSAGEAAAIAALKPAMNDCLAPGKNFTVKRADLRLIVAEPLYHMISK